MTQDICARLRYQFPTTVIARSTAVEDLEIANEQRREAAAIIDLLVEELERVRETAETIGLHAMAATACRAIAVATGREQNPTNEADSHRMLPLGSGDAMSVTAELEKAAYEDGYSRAVSDIDLLTGGDGEYRYCMGGGAGHCPDAETMKARIEHRFMRARQDAWADGYTAHVPKEEP